MKTPTRGYDRRSQFEEVKPPEGVIWDHLANRVLFKITRTPTFRAGRTHFPPKVNCGLSWVARVDWPSLQRPMPPSICSEYGGTGHPPLTHGLQRNAPGNGVQTASKYGKRNGLA